MLNITRLERLASDKHSNLLVQFVSYEENNCYECDTRGMYHKTYYGRNLRIYVIS